MLWSAGPLRNVVFHVAETGRSQKVLPAYSVCYHMTCRVIGRLPLRDESLCHSALHCEQRITRSSRATQWQRSFRSRLRVW
jgi:hypothetical protein